MPKTVQQALALQQEKIKFDPVLISQFLYGKSQYKKLRQTLERYEPPEHDFNLENRSRQQIIKRSIRDCVQIYSYIKTDISDQNCIYFLLSSGNQVPGLPHVGMFMRCIEFMGSQQQKSQYLNKCSKFQIVGCYAQTQMAHGSDVSSLMTTATFNKEKDQFIIDTPDIRAIKFWPGELGLYCNYALVFAQLIVGKKNYGVQSFIIKIRDDDMKPLPGIEVGDIGPKIGYSTRDNGYLIINKVSIPRKNMLSRYINISREGEVKTKGNPKVGYATMMQIRKLISCFAPKLYANAIVISTRYSIFRTQFKNSRSQQVKIMDYQLQQQKIIDRVSQYFAITIAGNKINKLSTLNAKLVVQKQDFSLMEQTHCCLSLSKPYFTQLVYDGMEICRKACGGHGFSNYSGFPSLIHEYAANLTHEGQNTVLYLQVARYLMKNFKQVMSGSKIKDNSIKYLQKSNQLLQQKCQVKLGQKWTTTHIQTLLAQSICYLLKLASQKFLQNSQSENSSQKDIFNKIIGINLRDLAILHSIYYSFNSFKQKVDSQDKDSKIRHIVEDLCMLFGVSQLLLKASSLIQSSLISKQQIEQLKSLKQSLLERIRPDIIGIVDGFGIPHKYIKSALIYGNPYQNYLKLARQCQLNDHQRTDIGSGNDRNNKNMLPSVKVVLTIKNHLNSHKPRF